MFCTVRAGSGKEQVFKNVFITALLHLKKERAIVQRGFYSVVNIIMQTLVYEKEFTICHRQ
jgi:hypothetical protein